MTTVSYIGLCDLARRSCSPNARAIERWVTHEIFPSIYKSGVYVPFDDPVALARVWADAVDREKAERAEKEKAQAALRVKQAAHLDTKRELSAFKYKLAELNYEFSVMLKVPPTDDMQSAYDMQASLNKYFDVDKYIGDVGFWWYMSTFMRTYCHGGIHYARSNDYIDDVEFALSEELQGHFCAVFALPEELQGHFYHVAKCDDDVLVFPKRAWDDVIAYFEHHRDSLKNLPYIGCAARS